VVMIVFKPCDLIFTRERGVIPSLIAWGTRSRGEEKTFATHVAGFISRTLIVEALWTAEVLTYSRYLKVKHEVWRKEDLGLDRAVRVVSKADSYVGKRYGVFKIFTHSLDCLAQKVLGGDRWWFRKLNHLHHYPICSWLWAFAFEAGGVSFGVPPAYATPDDMHDWVRRADNAWVRVWEWDPAVGHVSL
jgi:hypothetical protein